MEKTIFQETQKGDITLMKSIRMVDLNGKKHCQVMVEVNFAPSKPVYESDMRGTVFQITWDDGSQGSYQLVDIYRFTFANYCTHFTWPSHGMDFCDFYAWWKERYSEVDTDTRMAAYFYKKIIY